ncbi:MAG: hypothetical protein DMG23_04550 [Acidobacteria bacterium]|nr:MAG: hypothetical protein DMG23_04550 [Acidobacteriota bacterium]
MNLVLLVGKEWKARVLLRAQLIEEGLEVEAHESVRSALESLVAGLNLITSKILRGREFELILTRPVDVGELVAQIKQRVGTDSP